MPIFLYDLISSFFDTLRVLLIGVFGQQLSLIFMDRCCRRERNTVPLRLIMMARSTVLLTWDSYLALQGLLLPQQRLLFVFFNFLASIIVYLAFFWTYEGTFPVKTLLATVLSEFVVATATLLAVIPVNLLEGRADYTTMQGRLHPFDLLLPGMIAGLFFLILFLIQKILVWFRDWTPVHRKLWLCFHLVFWVALQMNVLFEGLGDVHVLSFLAFLQYQAAAILTLLAGILYFLYRYVRTPAAGLSPFQEFLKEYAGSFSGSVKTDAVQSPGQVPPPLHQLAATGVSSPENSSEYREYLTQVRESARTVSRNQWCADWKVNAVLSALQEKTACSGMGLSCDFMGFSCGQIDPEDFASLLYLIFRPLSGKPPGQGPGGGRREGRGRRGRGWFHVPDYGEREPSPFLWRTAPCPLGRCDSGWSHAKAGIVLRCAATQYFLILQIQAPRLLTDTRDRKLHSLLQRYRGIITTVFSKEQVNLTIVLNRGNVSR